MSLIENVARMPDWPTDTFKTTLPDDFTTGPTSIWFDANVGGDGGAIGYMLVRFRDAVTYAAGQPRRLRLLEFASVSRRRTSTGGSRSQDLSPTR